MQHLLQRLVVRQIVDTCQMPKYGAIDLHLQYLIIYELTIGWRVPMWDDRCRLYTFSCRVHPISLADRDALCRVCRPDRAYTCLALVVVLLPKNPLFKCTYHESHSPYD
jgi:hypothetical protein